METAEENNNDCVIGVLALQGAFREHVQHLQKLGLGPHQIREVRLPQDLLGLDGLIMPGGESTAMCLIAERSHFFDALSLFVNDPSKGIWGTCAGLILLSKDIEAQKQGGQSHLAVLDVTTCRNYFGRQKNSFISELQLSTDLDSTEALHLNHQLQGVFIRAPAIMKVNDKQVKILATVNHK